MMKVCKRCGAEKDETLFLSRMQKDGHVTRGRLCKLCKSRAYEARRLMRLPALKITPNIAAVVKKHMDEVHHLMKVTGLTYHSADLMRMNLIDTMQFDRLNELLKGMNSEPSTHS